MPEDALKTDLYQLTMMAAYESAGKNEEKSTFTLFFRKLPEGRNYVIAAGMEQALGFLQSLHFTEEQIAYVRALPAFAGQPGAFFERLHGFRFTGDAWMVDEGTPVFAGEPMLMIRAPIFESQLVETFILNVVGSASMFASKAARVVESAAPAGVMEFGSRRSHNPEAAIACARAAFIAGCVGTSNVEAGFRFGIPVMGTMAHSFVMSFASELEAFRAYAAAFPDNTVLLVDTYDIRHGVEHAITVAKEMETAGRNLRGIRIDSGDLALWSKKARIMLDDAGLEHVKITLSSDLDENKIAELHRQGAQFDFAGVGTMLATSYDEPHLGVVYKLCEHEVAGQMEPKIKVSEGKTTLGGLKQVYRYFDENGTATWDEICLAEETRQGAVPLLRKVMENGKLTCALPTLPEIRKYAAEQRDRLPAELRGLKKADYAVEVSPKLEMLQAHLIKEALERKRLQGPLIGAATEIRSQKKKQAT